MADLPRRRVTLASALMLSVISAALMSSLATLVALGVCAISDKADETGVPWIALFAALFGGCAGVATFLPRGGYRLVSSLTIIFIATLVGWYVFAAPFSASLAHRRSSWEKGDHSVPAVTVSEERRVTILYVIMPVVITGVLTSVRILFPELAGATTEKRPSIGKSRSNADP